MDEIWKEVLWSQFGAAIDMFGCALSSCPNELWTAPMWNDPTSPPGLSDFWYVAYHTQFWLDLYLSGAAEGFVPPAPFDLNELNPRGLLPERIFTRNELLSYLSHCRRKCSYVIEQLTDEKAHRLCLFPWKKTGLSYAELLVDNMRHVQEHGAQLNMFLGQQAGVSTRWLAQAGNDG